MRDHAHRWIQGGESRLAGGRLALADLVGGEHHLPLQIGKLDAIVIDETDGADSGRRQIQCGRRPEPTSTDNQYRTVRQSLLTSWTHFSQRKVPCVAGGIGYSVCRFAP